MINDRLLLYFSSVTRWIKMERRDYMIISYCYMPTVEY